MSRLGILGGTFDPVHLGHLVLAEAAREQLRLDKVLFIPTGHSWRKPEREITPGEHRLEMVRLAIADNPAFEASSAEIDRPGPTYSDVTLEELHDAHPDAKLYFILGRDALLDLPNWRAPERIVELSTLAVAERAWSEADPNGDAAVAALRTPIERITMPEIGVSATDLRERVCNGLSIRYLVPEAVRTYISDRGLYREG
jgi:nicotinate-nucleotide adenylyltransferase